jgi:ERCC4-type nuclease
MECTLDNRERKLAPLLPDVPVAQLDIGDFELRVDTKRYIFERKTVSDLESSIKDGRWREQKMRCMASGAVLIYIIEAWNDSLFEEASMIRTAIVNTMLRDNIMVVFTKSLQGTADFIKSIIQVVEKDPQKFVSKGGDYTECLIKSSKKSNITHESVFIHQLCSVPGISYKKAKTIIDHTNTKCIGELCQVINHDSTVLLKCSGIGKKLSDTLINYLCLTSSK